MIRKIYANDPRFKSVEFHPGLNIILAERSEQSGKKDTRNGTGKTTLINVMHFCLGADLNKLDLPTSEIKQWEFFIELDVCGEVITAKRAIDNQGIIYVFGNFATLPLPPAKDEETGEFFFKLDDWRILLGICLYNLKASYVQKYHPRFRGLISYFIRKGMDAYSSPFLHFRQQHTFDWEISNYFLLGLPWEHAAEAQIIRDKTKNIKKLNDIIKAGLISSQGELEAERLRLEKQIEKESTALRSFRVHPQYKEIQEQADTLTKRLHGQNNKLFVLKQKLARYEESITSETPPTNDKIEQLYEEAGVLFPDTIKRTLNEAHDFHKQIVKNRQEFLRVEVIVIKGEITSLENAIQMTTDGRASLMGLLETHGALEEFYGIQKKLLEKKELLEVIKSKLTSLNEVASHKNEVKIAKLELEAKLQRDYQETRSCWEKAVEVFSENSLALYDTPGDLIIEPSENGYKLDVEIKRGGSEGVSKMKIFCYDMMLLELFSERKCIDFLVHDSTIFDGVDSRQRAKALNYACERASEKGIQYICAINSDMIPYDDLQESFDIEKYIAIKLGDDSPSSSLMGFHFEIKRKGSDEN